MEALFEPSPVGLGVRQDLGRALGLGLEVFLPSPILAFVSREGKNEFLNSTYILCE